MKFDEHTTKILLTSVLLGISLLIALVLESAMTSGVAGELVVIFIGSVLFAVILAGLWLEEPWVGPVAAAVFVLALINIIWLFTATKSVLGLILGLVVNIAGVVLSLSGTTREDSLLDHTSAFNLETYDAGAANSAGEFSQIKRKRGRPPKNALS